MHDINRVLFLKVSFLIALLVPATVISPFTTIYASLKSDGFDLRIVLLNLIFPLVEFGSFDKSFTSILFLVTNFDTVE